MLLHTINTIFYFYYVILVLRIFLTWISNIDWYQQPYEFLRSITDPFLNVFRGIIPPIGGVLDISPILAFLVLQFVQGLLNRLIIGF